MESHDTRLIRFAFLRAFRWDTIHVLIPSSWSSMLCFLVLTSGPDMFKPWLWPFHSINHHEKGLILNLWSGAFVWVPTHGNRVSIAHAMSYFWFPENGNFETCLASSIMHQALFPCYIYVYRACSFPMVPWTSYLNDIYPPLPPSILHIDGGFYSAVLILAALYLTHTYRHYVPTVLPSI